MSEEEIKQTPDQKTSGEQPVQQEEESKVRRPLTEKERELRQRQRDLEFLKRKQMIREAGTQEDKEKVYNSIHYNHVALQPTTAAKKAENFWYHHKLTIIFLTIIIGLFTWFIVDMATNTRYDLDMGLLTFETYGDDYTELPNAWTQYMDDQTGDNEVNIQIMNVEYDLSGDDEVSDTAEEEIFAATTNTAYYETEADVTHLAVIFAKNSDYFALIIDQNYYDYLTEEGIVFANLRDLVGDNDALVGDDRYSLADDPDFAEFTGNDDCYLVLRDTSTINGYEKASKKLQKKYEISKQFVIDLINKTDHTAEE